MQDSWVSYGKYEGCTHYLCNAHRLRDLSFIVERYQQPWTFQMPVLLGTIKRAVDASTASGQTAFAPEWILAFEQCDQAVIVQGLAANPPPSSPVVKPRGRFKQSSPRNLLLRIKQQQVAVLRFMHDFYQFRLTTIRRSGIYA